MSVNTMNFDALANADAFKKLTLKKAAKLGGITEFGSEATVGDVLFKLNMVAIAWEIKHPKVDPGFIIVRYSTDHSSWMTPYTNKEIAIKHIIDNINIHFSDKDESELADFHEEAKRVMDDGDESAEFGSLNIEIEYGATMSAM